MPIYAFRCSACGHAFDRLQKLSDPDPDACPACGQAAVARQVTAPAFRLAGSGWYETDFKGKGDSRRNLAGDAGGEKPASGAGKSEAKEGGGTAPAPAPAPASAKPSASPKADAG